MIEDYIKAKRRGEKEYRRAVSSGKYPYLPALDDILDAQHQQNQIPMGITELPLSMIVGTKTNGRQNAFSCGFMPLLSDKSEFAMKWSSLYEAQMSEGLRDPVLVYEYMNRFYVQEGNKRVSVMRFLQSYSIAADVIRILPEKSQDPAVEIYYEFVDFFASTKLNEITFSEKGRYLELSRLMGQKLGTPWPAQTVELLRSGFLAFQEVYDEKRGYLLDITPGDAFLLYLRIFSLEDLLNDTKDKLKQKMNRIWKEFLTEQNEDNIALLEVPEDVVAEEASTGIKRLFSSLPSYTQRSPLKVAFLYEKAPALSAWIYGHELGRTQLEDTFCGIVKTQTYEGLDMEEKIEAALESAMKDGCGLIFTTSASLMPTALRFAVDHPAARILNCSINLSHNAVRTYYSRMYEAKFLMGALAASLCDSDRIGYVADYPVYGSIANINAFAIGAALLRPNVKIILKWSTQKGVDWKKDFTWEGINVISGPDFIRVEEEEREYGLYYKKEDALVRLAAPIWEWGRYYELIVKSVINGTYDTQMHRADQALNYWYGMSSGVIDIILSKKLSYYSEKLVNILRREIISGDLMPFEGPLKSQDGTVMAKEDTVLTSEEIITMDWLSDNVVGEIPKLTSIAENAKKTVKISGVTETKKDSQEE